MLKAILFDLDDTLIEWGDYLARWEEVEARHIESVHRFLTETVDKPPELEDYFTAYRERTRNAWLDARTSLIAPHIGRVLVETAVALGVAENQLDVDRCLDHYDWRAVPGTRVFSDVEDALSLLSKRGLVFGLVTNAYQPMRLRDIEMDDHGLLDFFPTCRISAADVGYLKPHPSIFEAALECLGVEPDQAVFVGDNLTADIGGAQAAGMLAILRRLPNRNAPLSEVIVPDAVVDTLLELPELFDEWFLDGWGHRAPDTVDHK